ncbi:MAG: group 1 truncated hemoglobin [Nannocystis sp.]|nr:group 1 truncated hemoglobin [Nannocystis sp.]
MRHKAIAPFVLLLGLGAFPACNGDDTAGTDTDTGTATDTDTDTTTTTTSTSTSTTTSTTTASSESETDTTTSTTDPTTSTTSSCEEGTQGCPCGAGDSCDEGLACENAVCVPVVEATFCERIGGETGINELHVAFVTKVLLDERINGYFLNSDVDGGNLISCLNKQIGAAIECPGVEYDCLDMLTAHAGMGVSTVDFTDLAEDYQAALTEHQGTYPDLTGDDVTTIMTVLAGMAGDIVEDADNNVTVYQRVGRKPAVRALVGFPGEVGSFIDNVANNPVINGFFGNSDIPRLNTCLTRQVSSIDGPIVYGGEVDSPGVGIDEGVSIGAPCLDMKTSHEGLVDDMASVINIEDFTALVTDLITAMTTFNVAADDQMAILSVLGPMCEDIVADSPNDCPGNSEVVELELVPQNTMVPDDAYNGTLASMRCATIEAADNGLNIIDGVKLTSFSLTHTWLGDVVVKVVAPDNTAITVLSRPGFAEPADNGTGGVGDSSNIEAGFPISFADDGAKDAELMGNESALSNFVVCKEAPMACSYLPNPGAATAGNFASLKGKAANGNWQVCVGDAGVGDNGTFVSAKLELTRVKFPNP